MQKSIFWCLLAGGYAMASLLIIGRVWQVRAARIQPRPPPQVQELGLDLAVQESEATSGSQTKAAFHSGMQQMGILVGFGAVLAGLALYTLFFLHMGRWLLGRQ